LLNRIKALILTFNPSNNGELVLHQETLRQLSEYSGLRHNRIIGGDTTPSSTNPLKLSNISSDKNAEVLGLDR
jgi:hypothetical protein